MRMSQLLALLCPALFLIPSCSCRAATLSFGEGSRAASEIYAGGCVPHDFEVLIHDLPEPVRELEFSIELPEGVGVECVQLPAGELVIDGNNFRFRFDECLLPGELIVLVHLRPLYEPVIRGQGCLAAATPSQLGLTAPGYRSCSGEIRELEVWSWLWLPEGCVDMYLDRGGLAEEASWGMLKASF